jgi:hypothetical protein
MEKLSIISKKLIEISQERSSGVDGGAEFDSGFAGFGSVEGLEELEVFPGSLV